MNAQQLDLFPASAWCERWTDRRHAWRHLSDGGFDARRFNVAPLVEADAKAYVTRHHYSGTYPSARLRYGLYERSELVGVAVLSVPVRSEVLTGVFPQLEPYTESLELGRFVLAEGVAANGESWFLGRLFEQAARDGLRGIVSFSDPAQRTTSSGQVVMPGHVGTIYQATNALYLGRARARTLLLLPDGTVLNDRAIQKVKAQEKGHEYVERLLIGYGASAPRAGQAMRAWLADAIDAIGVRRLRHQGNHRFGFCLGTPAERRAIKRMVQLERRPYPKAVDRAA
jgi:hypothetical protein